MSGKLLWLALAATALFATGAKAETTVECQSINFQYDECHAAKLKNPQLIHQISSSACILNNTWGFNPKTRYIWVANGCSGVFADAGGYHHGRGDGFDPGARRYGDRGHDVGAVVGGVVLDALVKSATRPKGERHATSNVPQHSGYSGCHGLGCLVDDPSTVEIDGTPQFDSNGEPNFDTEGNYQGCHGDGCLVDQ